MILRWHKGESVVAENPKGGIAENFGRIQSGTTQICLEKEDMGGGGGGAPRKSAKVIKRYHFSELTFKGGICEISTCLAPNPPPPPPPPAQAINNGRSLNLPGLLTASDRQMSLLH